MNFKNLLITGSTGMLGRNFIENFDYNNIKLFAPNKKTLDLKYFNQIYEYLSKHKIDSVLHCAAIVGGIHDNIMRPADYLVKNIEINKNTILASKKAGIKNFLNFGCSCIYPKDYSKTLSEEMVFNGNLEPTNEGYALSKLFSIKLCEYISKESNEFRYKSLIPCNLYGKYDKFDPNKSHLLAAIVQKLVKAEKNNLKFVEIWGDGKPRREFMHVVDLVDAIKFSFNNFDKIPHILNVGTGIDYSVDEYYKLTSQILKYKCQLKHDLAQPSGMKRKLLNVKKINDLGWKSKIDLTEGIKHTIKFYKENFNEKF